MKTGKQAADQFSRMIRETQRQLKWAGYARLREKARKWQQSKRGAVERKEP